MISTTSHVFSPPTWATRFLKGHIKKKIQCPSRYVTMYIKYSFYTCNRHLFASGSASAGAFTWFYCWRCVKATQRHTVNKVNAFYVNEKANLCFKDLHIQQLTTIYGMIFRIMTTAFELDQCSHLPMNIIIFTHKNCHEYKQMVQQQFFPFT